MIRAIQLDQNGNEMEGMTATFSEKHWEFMVAHFGHNLRWKSIEKSVDKKNKFKEKQIEDEKTDFPSDGGDVSAAIAD